MVDAKSAGCVCRLKWIFLYKNKYLLKRDGKSNTLSAAKSAATKEHIPGNCLLLAFRQYFPPGPTLLLFRSLFGGRRVAATFGA
jgi:hypothetical protein